MIGSAPPNSEQPDWHPVHRANALLREALQNTTRSFEALEAHYSVESLSHAIESVMQGPVRITYPTPLAVRLDGLEIEERAIPGLEALMRPAQHAPGNLFAEFQGDSDDGPAPVGEDDELDALPPEIWDDAMSGPGVDDAATLRADAPLDPDLRPRPVHMQTLLGEFHRSQRHASLLVAASVAIAIVLTIGGVVIAASFASPRPNGGDHVSPPHATSVVWKTPAARKAQARLQLAAVPANRAAPQTILAASGRQIAFGPLLPASDARYLLIRGLPPEAALSAGRQSGGGAWLVKAELVPGLVLTVGQAAAGDYPVEIYMLESGDGPQPRRNFMLRITTPGDAYAAASSPKLSAHVAAPEEPAVPAEPSVLHERAVRLLGEGDIAAARLLLLHLAERGNGEAAYVLARTFDREGLIELGAKSLDGDPALARDWYERAVRDGNVKAAERLKVLASLSGTPSD